MSDLLRERINGLFEGLNWNDGDGQFVWDLLSALRGPDNADEELKWRTTKRLRSALAPQFFGDHAFPLPDKPEEKEFFSSFETRVSNEIYQQHLTAQRHFVNHYARACWAYWKYYRVEKGEEAR